MVSFFSSVAPEVYVLSAMSEQSLACTERLARVAVAEKPILAVLTPCVTNQISLGRSK
jgi:hypothetical protein